MGHLIQDALVLFLVERNEKIVDTDRKNGKLIIIVANIAGRAPLPSSDRTSNTGCFDTFSCREKRKNRRN